MGVIKGGIDDRLAKFLLDQPVFFVATAPLSPDGHVNCSPKGLKDTFAILGPSQVAYLDLTGSGAETAAHIRENGRVTLMFCAFQGPPRIVRLQGRGTLVLPGERDFALVESKFLPDRLGARAIVSVAVDRISNSCGYGVPLMTFEREREDLDHWSQRKGPDGLQTYRSLNNAVSIDGLPALPSDRPQADLAGSPPPGTGRPDSTPR